MMPNDDGIDDREKPGIVNAKQFNYLHFRFCQFLSNLKSRQATTLIRLIKEKDYEDYILWKKTIQERHSDDNSLEDLK